MKDKISLQAHWFDKCKKFSEEQLKEIYYLIIRYWLYEESIGEIDDPAIDVAFAFIKDQIDLMESRAERKVEDFQRANEERHKGSHEEMVAELLRENPKYSSVYIGEKLGINPSTVRGYSVWKQRKALEKRLPNVGENALENVDSTLESVGTNRDYVF